MPNPSRTGLASCGEISTTFPFPADHPKQLPEQSLRNIAHFLADLRHRKPAKGEEVGGGEPRNLSNQSSNKTLPVFELLVDSGQRILVKEPRGGMKDADAFDLWIKLILRQRSPRGGRKNARNGPMPMNHLKFVPLSPATSHFARFFAPGTIISINFKSAPGT
ncbi:MAG TPA: hypothetical protein VGY56_12320, partial [Verrucomicrobiae bacterium]|nr:hypothetical protein [Verrucomicrobiae bacterium]